MIIEKDNDLSKEELNFLYKNGYVGIDIESTGLDYTTDSLCTIQLQSGDMDILIKFHYNIEYSNLKNLFLSNKILKIFHHAVFDVSFLMKNLDLDTFGLLACTKIASKIVNGLDHNNSLKPLLKEYLGIEIDKTLQKSDWSTQTLSVDQKIYAINDVKYLYPLWNALSKQLLQLGEYQTAIACFKFVPSYKKITDKGITNIFAY